MTKVDIRTELPENFTGSSCPDVRQPIVVRVGNRHEWIKAECKRLAIEVLERSYGYEQI